jgi:hypothetical protein
LAVVRRGPVAGLHQAARAWAGISRCFLYPGNSRLDRNLRRLAVRMLKCAGWKWISLLFPTSVPEEPQGLSAPVLWRFSLVAGNRSVRPRVHSARGLAHSKTLSRRARDLGSWAQGVAKLR